LRIERGILTGKSFMRPFPKRHTCAISLFFLNRINSRFGFLQISQHLNIPVDYLVNLLLMLRFQWWLLTSDLVLIFVIRREMTAFRINSKFFEHSFEICSRLRIYHKFGIKWVKRFFSDHFFFLCKKRWRRPGPRIKIDDLAPILSGNKIRGTPSRNSSPSGWFFVFNCPSSAFLAPNLTARSAAQKTLARKLARASSCTYVGAGWLLGKAK
jgi:hypothetical protein